MKISITHIDTACIILDINGYRILTDPVLDQAGEWYHFGYGTVSKKQSTPALSIDEIGQIDMVLLSHHQHKDNFDNAGRALAKTVPVVLTTKPGAKQLENGIGLDEWEVYKMNTDKVPEFKITAMPAQHHPWWLPGFFAGKVIGFMLEWEGHGGGVYISGDTVYFSGIEEIARRYQVDMAILHLGSVKFPYLTGAGRYTFNAREAIKTGKLLEASTVVPIHSSGWSHFKQHESAAKAEFDKSLIAEQVVWLEPGKVFNYEAQKKP